MSSHNTHGKLLAFVLLAFVPRASAEVADVAVISTVGVTAEFDGTTLTFDLVTDQGEVTVTEGLPHMPTSFQNLTFHFSATYGPPQYSLAVVSLAGTVTVTFSDGTDTFELGGPLWDLNLTVDTDPTWARFSGYFKWKATSAALPPQGTGVWPSPWACWMNGSGYFSALLPIDFTGYDWDQPSPWTAETEHLFMVFYPNPQCSLTCGCQPYNGGGPPGPTLSSYARLHDCMTGPVATSMEHACDDYDFNCDGHIDLAEFAEFQRRFGVYCGKPTKASVSPSTEQSDSRRNKVAAELKKLPIGVVPDVRQAASRSVPTPARN